MAHYPSLAMALRPFQGTLPNIDPDAWVDPSAQVIGDVTVGAGSSIWPLAAVRGDVQSIRVGCDTSIQDNCVLHVTHRSSYNPDGFSLTIGDQVTVGHRAILHGCAIGDRVLIGMGSTLLDGAVVEDEVIIGANSLVTAGKVLRSGYLYAGSPAKERRPLTETERASLPYMAQNYVKLMAQHREENPS